MGPPVEGRRLVKPAVPVAPAALVPDDSLAVKPAVPLPVSVPLEESKA